MTADRPKAIISEAPPERPAIKVITRADASLIKLRLEREAREHRTNAWHNLVQRVKARRDARTNPT